MEYFKLPEFVDTESDPSIANDFFKSQEEPEESFGKAEQFAPDRLEPKKGSTVKKIDHSRFNSAEFNEVDTLLTNVEDYAQRIREDVDKYAREVRNETDLFRSEIELELASALVKRIEAEKKAAEIIKTAEETRDAVHQQGKKEGFDAGMLEGMNQYKEKNDENTGNVLALLNELQGLRLAVMQQYEEQIINLSLLMAKKVVHTELKTDKTVVLEMLKDNMHHFDGMGKIKIKVNPVEFDFISEHQSEVKKFIDEEQVVSFKADSNIQPSSPVIESDFSAVDLDLEKQFKEIAARLADCIDDRRALFNQS